jgi:Right handed beta helix region
LTLSFESNIVPEIKNPKSKAALWRRPMSVRQSAELLAREFLFCILSTANRCAHFRVVLKVVILALLGTAVSSAALAAVRAPQPPKSCSVPAGAVRVNTVAQLQSELAKTAPRDIAIAPGNYAPATVLKPAAAHRLWGTNANAVTIRAGFTFVGAGKPGFAVRCVTLDVTQPNRADQRSGTAIIHSSRNWTNLTVADSRLLGNKKIGRAIFVEAPSGLKVERVEIRGFTQDGIRVKNGSGSVSLRDLDIRDIERPGPATYNGKAEAGIYIDKAATIERVRVRNAYWMGIGAYDHDITIRDLDVDNSSVGVYVEHFTHRLVLENFYIGRSVTKGVNFEWDNPQQYSGAPTSVDAVVQDGVIEAFRIGAAVNEGQKNPTIRRVTFRNQCGAAIIGYRPRSTGEVYVNNNYSGIKASAQEVSTKPPNAMKCS